METTADNRGKAENNQAISPQRRSTTSGQPIGVVDNGYTSFTKKCVLKYNPDLGKLELLAFPPTLLLLLP